MWIPTKQNFTVVYHITKLCWDTGNPSNADSNLKYKKLSLFFTCHITVVYSDDNNVIWTYYNCKYYVVTIDIGSLDLILKWTRQKK
jgi:hypothetical protein